MACNKNNKKKPENEGSRCLCRLRNGYAIVKYNFRAKIVKIQIERVINEISPIS